MQTIIQRKNVLYPLLVMAAVSVIVLSGLGIAALTGLLPEARSDSALLSQSRVCASCGVIETVTPYQVKGSSSGVGAITGGAVGGLIGNTIGAGTGHVLAILAGAGGGAYAGNEVEKDMKKYKRYRITVRMNDGSTRVFHTPLASWRPGDHVRVSGDGLTAES
ncbi:MAG TPA: glycine zipper 2TM domain-containing protein [Burkholderiales bacterium]|nr:glycine zipper 2TM domain-containing protein [Burkholderiales bacterium]